MQALPRENIRSLNKAALACQYKISILFLYKMQNQRPLSIKQTTALHPNQGLDSYFRKHVFLPDDTERFTYLRWEPGRMILYTERLR